MTYTEEQIIHAEELRNERIGLHKEYERLSGEKRISKGSKKSGLTRKQNGIHAHILELNATLRDSPPSPCFPTEAIREIGFMIQEILDISIKARERFLVRCTDNPEYAIKHCLRDMMIAKAKVDLLRHISKTLQSDLTNLDELDILKEAVHDTKERIMNETALNISGLSTSREINLLDEYKHEAAILLVQRRMAHTNIFDQIDNIFAGVEMWRILNKLEVN